MRLKLVPNETTINFFGKSNVFFGVSIFAVILSFITYIILGLNFGIDFKGGLLIEIATKNNSDHDGINCSIKFA